MSHSHVLIDGVTSWTGFRRLIYVLIPITALFVWLDAANHGSSIQCWNWMYYTGVVTFGVAIALAINLPAKLDDTIEALRDNNALVMTGAELSAISHRMSREARPWRLWCAVLIFLVVFGCWTWVVAIAIKKANLEWNHIEQLKQQYGPAAVVITIGLLGFIILVMGVCGFYAGAFFGTTIAHGNFASVLADPQINLRIRADHFDGASGLKPIGDLYLYQAFLTALPLLWFAGWWLIIPVYEPKGCVASPDYSSWRWPFVVQWLVTLAFTYLGFVRPILKLRNRVTGEQRRLESEEIPRIREQIHKLQQQLLGGHPSLEEKNFLNAEIDRLGSYLWSVRQMSRWPMDATTQRRYFSVNALVSVVPPVIEALFRIGAIAVHLPDTGPWKWLKALVSAVL